MKHEAEENAEQDKKIKEEIDAINKADSVIFSTEKQIKDFEDKMINNEKEQLQSKLDDIKKAKELKNITDINKNIDELNQIWASISTRIYQQPNTNQPPTDDGKAQDVDFEEVK